MPDSSAVGDDGLHEAPTLEDRAVPDDGAWAWEPEPLQGVYAPYPGFDFADDPTEPVPIAHPARHRAAVLTAAAGVAVVIIGGAAFLLPGSGPDAGLSKSGDRERTAAPTTSTSATVVPSTTIVTLPPTTVASPSRSTPPPTTPTPTTPPPTSPPTTAPGGLLDLLPPIGG